MRKLIYILREAFEGFRRARLSAFMTIFVVAFFLILIGVMGILSFNIDRMIQELNAKVDIQAFIANTLDDSQIDTLRTKISGVEGIVEIDFYSKDEAAKEFQREFGQDIFDVLEHNPLPSSFNIKLSKERQNPKDLEKIAKIIERERGIDQVLYHSQALTVLTRYARIAKLLNVIVLVFVSIGSLLIISNTIRLIILAKKQIITTMQLVGATRRFVRWPFLVEGIFQGTIGGILAFLFLVLAVRLIEFEVPGIIYCENQHLALLVVFGFLFGFVGSNLAVRKYL